jgi:hypothetical protein
MDEDVKRISRQLRYGCAFYYQGSPGCQAMLIESLRMDSSNADAWREYSIPYLKRGIGHEWIGPIDSAVKYDAFTWQGYRGYNKLYFYRDFDGAIADFNATDTLTPGFTDYPQGQSVDYMRGIAYLGKKEFKNAIAYLERYMEEVTNEQGVEWADAYAFLYLDCVF